MMPSGVNMNDLGRWKPELATMGFARLIKDTCRRLFCVFAF